MSTRMCHNAISSDQGSSIFLRVSEQTGDGTLDYVLLLELRQKAEQKCERRQKEEPDLGHPWAKQLSGGAPASSHG